MQVELEQDAVPIVRIIGAMARRSLADAATAKRASQVTGSVVLQSATDPQAVTMRFHSNVIAIERGVAADADVVITADLTDPDAKPKVTGAARHPRLALLAGKLLEPPTGPWHQEADRFFGAALTAVDCPRPVKVVCTDDAMVRQWGGEGSPAVELHGPAAELASAFSGSTVMAEQVVTGSIQLTGNLRDLSVLTRFSIDHLFGEL